MNVKMKGLVIDSTTDRLCLAVQNGERAFLHLGEAGAKKHNASLLAAIEALLAEAGLEVSALTHVGVVVGPGSFTGIRVGVATANAIAFALGLSVVELTANEAGAPAHDALTVIDCKHGYYALKRQGGRDEYFAAEYDEINQFGLPIIELKHPEPAKMLAVFLQKADCGAKEARPFYIKPTSAERN